MNTAPIVVMFNEVEPHIAANVQILFEHEFKTMLPIKVVLAGGFVIPPRAPSVVRIVRRQFGIVILIGNQNSARGNFICNVFDPIIILAFDKSIERKSESNISVTKPMPPAIGRQPRNQDPFVIQTALIKNQASSQLSPFKNCQRRRYVGYMANHGEWLAIWVCPVWLLRYFSYSKRLPFVCGSCHKNSPLNALSRMISPSDLSLAACASRSSVATLNAIGWQQGVEFGSGFGLQVCPDSIGARQSRRLPRQSVQIPHDPLLLANINHSVKSHTTFLPS
jgi:hypothetical protein